MFIVRNKGSNYPLKYHTENATLKQILNRARPTAQRLASSVRELTGTLQARPPFQKKEDLLGICMFIVNTT